MTADAATQVARVSTQVSSIIEILNPTETLSPGGARIQVDKLPEEGSLQPGSGQVAYNVRVSNRGEGTANDVQLIEELLEGVVLVEVNPGNPTCTKTANAINCTLGNLAGGQTAQVNILVETSGVDPLLSRTIVRSAQLPDVALDKPYIIKFASPAFIQPNGEVTWAIRLLNPSTSPVTDIVITDALPSQLEVISATSTVGRPTISAEGQISLRVARLNPIDALTITVRTRLRPEYAPSPVVSNNACLRTAQQPQPFCVKAPVFRIDRLPLTGESPWENGRWITFGIVGLFGGLAALVVICKHRARIN